MRTLFAARPASSIIPDSLVQATRPFWGRLTMPKQKTHKGSKKRFKVTATGKLKRRQSGKRHLNRR